MTGSGWPTILLFSSAFRFQTTPCVVFLTGAQAKGRGFSCFRGKMEQRNCSDLQINYKKVSFSLPNPLTT